MKKVLSLFVSLLFAGLTFAAEPAKNDKNMTGFMIIEEEVVTDMRELPFELLKQSQEDFAAKNFGEASADITTAAKILKSEGQRANDTKTKQNLTQSSDHLLQVAQNVKDQKIKTEKELNSEFSKAALNTANHHRLLAAEEWSKKEYKQAGHDLVAASKATEHALEWSGKEVEKGTKEVVQGTKDIGNKLIEGAKWTSAEVKTTFDKFEKATENLRKKII